jgi:hypothetical protein
MLHDAVLYASSERICRLASAAEAVSLGVSTPHGYGIQASFDRRPINPTNQSTSVGITVIARSVVDESREEAPHDGGDFLVA